MKKYKAIKLEDKGFEPYVDSSNNQLKVLDGLSSINIFVGSNNTGKSRFLRMLAKTPSLTYRIPTINKTIYDQLESIEKQIKVAQELNDNAISFSVEHLGKGKPFGRSSNLLIAPQDFIQDGYNNIAIINDYKETYRMLMDGQYRPSSSGGGKGSLENLANRVKEILKANQGILNDIEQLSIQQGNYIKYYIPTLRGLNNFQQFLTNKAQDVFKERVIANYQIDEVVQKLTVFTGQELYERIKLMLLGTLDQRKRIRKFEEFLSTELFDNKEVTVIPRLDGDKNVLHVRIDKDEHPVYDLGDGIQSIITLTFPLFEAEHGIFFIEEPEIHLHPGMQRKLLKVFKKQKNHQYFISTHSNHFLDLSLDYEDISLYTFKKDLDSGKTEVKIVSSGDENMLQLLGAQNSSVFLSNSTVWVEGITDRLYIRKYLELYQQDKQEKISEDIDFSFVEYGGDNITHWSFLNKEDCPIDIEKLCAKSILITDKDGDKNLQRKIELKAVLGDRYSCLPCKEIENTLSPEVIGKVVESYEKRNKNLSFVMPIINKTKLKNTGIGKLITEVVFEKQPSNRQVGYAEKSGTIKDKVEFCKRAVTYITKENMTDTAKNLTETIYNFVIQQKHIRN